MRPDPRIGYALAELLANDGDYVFRDRLVPLIIRHGDERSSALLAAARPTVREWIAEGIAKILAKRPAPAAAKAAKARKPAGNVDKLFAEVYAHPESDDARSVLADALQAAGDPRGDFIALQLAATEESLQKADALLQAHAKDWVGELRTVIYRGQFKRGFLTRLELDGAWRTNAKGWDAVARSRELATVEDLIPGRAKGEPYARLLRESKTVRRVAVWDELTLAALAETAAPIEHVDVRWARRQKRGENAVRDRVLPVLAMLPKLTSLDIEAEQFEHLGSELRGRLEVLGIAYEMAPGLALWPKLPSTIRTLIVGRSRVMAECVATNVAWEGALRIDREGRHVIARAWGQHVLSDLSSSFKKLPKLNRLEVHGANGLEAKLRIAAKRARIPITFLPALRRSGYVTGLHK